MNRYQIQEFDEFIKGVTTAKIAAIDTEWDPYTDPFESAFHIHGLSCAYRDGKKVYAIYVTDHDQIQQLLDVLADGEKQIPAHYAQAEHMSIQGSGFTLRKDLLYRDTAIAINVLDEERPENRVGLKKLAPEFLNWELTFFSSEDMDSEEFRKYAMEDAVATLLLYELFEPALIKYNLYDVYVTICGSIQPFGDMTLSGMAYDLSVAEEQYEKIQTLRSGIESEIYKKIGRINLASPLQLRQRLFDELGYTAKDLDVSKKTQTVSTSVKNMTKLAEKYPVCELIFAHRTANKMISSMLEPWSSAVTIAEDQRMHPRYSFISATGRTRCSNPNVQQIPKVLGKNIKFNKKLKAYFADLKMRKGFIAPEGFKFVICDYSSAEYHIAAIAAQEPKLVDIYCSWECPVCGEKGYNNKVVRRCSSGHEVKQGGDLHQRNCDIANAAGAEITRNQAKAVSFLAIFGGSAWKLSKDLNLPVEVCEQILADVLDEFPGLREWHKKTATIADTTGEVRDIFGRRRKINLKQLLRQAPEEKHRGIRKNTINKLVNFVCQAPVSTICQLAFQNIRLNFKNDGLWLNEVYPAIMVHDSLGFYVREGLADVALTTILKEMEEAVEIAIPMNAEGGVFSSFAEED